MTVDEGTHLRLAYEGVRKPRWNISMGEAGWELGTDPLAASSQPLLWMHRESGRSLSMFLQPLVFPGLEVRRPAIVCYHTGPHPKEGEPSVTLEAAIFWSMQGEQAVPLAVQDAMAWIYARARETAPKTAKQVLARAHAPGGVQ